MVVGPPSIVGLGIRRALEQESGFDVVAETDSTDEALRFLDEVQPDVIVLDARLRESTPVDATRRLHQKAAGAPIVVVGGDDPATYLGAIAVGATAHVTESAQPAELALAIRRAAQGEDQLKEELGTRPDLVERIVDAFREGFRRQDGRPELPLTARELDVLRLVAQGRRNREIAELLGISQQTVKNHVSSILLRLGVANRERAVEYAVRQSWLVEHEVAAPEQ